MSQQVIQNVKAQRRKLFLTNPRAFYPLLRIPIQETGLTQTAATDGNTMFFNVSFTKRLSDDNLRGILLHEFLHILCKHRLRRGNFHPRLWNIATDYVINGWIIQSDRYGKDFTLPTSGLFHPLYSYGGRSAEEVAHDLLNRGWKTDEPPDYDCHVCRLAPVAPPAGGDVSRLRSVRARNSDRAAPPNFFRKRRFSRGDVCGVAPVPN
jgi:hypothetical protein